MIANHRDMDSYITLLRCLCIDHVAANEARCHSSKVLSMLTEQFNIKRKRTRQHFILRTFELPVLYFLWH